MAASGTSNFSLPIADLVVEAFSRLGLRGPALEAVHLIEARRSLNLILQDMSGGRGGPNLWAVSLLNIPLQPNVTAYTLPSSMIQILDVYIRQYTMATTATSIGAVLSPMVTQAGAPLIAQDGEPQVAQPTSGVFTTVAGSQTVTMYWPAHGLSVGDAFLFQTPVTLGPMTASGLQVVSSVVDSDYITVRVPNAATVSRTGVGGTPLYYTTSGSATVTVIQPGHGLVVGSDFTPGVATTVGGLTIPATAQTVVTVPNSYEVTFTFTSSATSTAVAFVNSGQIAIYSESSTVDPIDIVLSPMSRTDYASMPDKFSTGRPTTYWLDRVVPPVVTVWPVPETGQYYALGIYHMRQLQDANPVGGQTIDMPNRFLAAISAELCAAMAEKFAPEQWKDKAQYAKIIWDRAAIEDTEHTPLIIAPNLSVYNF